MLILSRRTVRLIRLRPRPLIRTRYKAGKNTAVNKYRSFKLRILILMGRHFSNVFIST